MPTGPILRTTNQRETRTGWGVAQVVRCRGGALFSISAAPRERMTAPAADELGDRRFSINRPHTLHASSHRRSLANTVIPSLARAHSDI